LSPNNAGFRRAVGGRDPQNVVSAQAQIKRHGKFHVFPGTISTEYALVDPISKYSSSQNPLIAVLDAKTQT
jgi:hypothetical protein